jgi:hypothetical protein
VEEGKTDRIADLLDEAAKEIEDLRIEVESLAAQVEQANIDLAGDDW